MLRNLQQHYNQLELYGYGFSVPRLQVSLVKYWHAYRQLVMAARFYNTSVFFQISRAARLHNRSLFSLEDILFWGLTNPDIPEADLDHYVSREARTRLQARVNDRKAAAEVDDKARFYSLCNEYSIPIPDTLGVIAGRNSSARRPLYAGLPTISAGDLPDGAFVAKPAWGSKGDGLVFFRKQEDVYYVAGEAYELEAMNTLLTEAAANDNLIVQRRITPHPSLSKISQSDSIQSVRIVTFLRDEVNVDTLFAYFKYVCGDNDVDNFSEGHTGNLLSNVDLDSGRTTRTFMKNPGQLGLVEIRTHPDSGEELDDVVLPHWPELLSVVSRAAKKFVSLRCLAWDIALTADGPVILEANQDWGIFPLSPFRMPKGVPDLNALITRA